MAQSPARDAKDFARLLLQTVERLSQDGDWVRAREAFDQAVADHPDHAFIAQLKAKPARRIGVFAAAERLREAEFPHLERRKVGTGRNTLVMYRAAAPVPNSTCSSLMRSRRAVRSWCGAAPRWRRGPSASRRAVPP